MSQKFQARQKVANNVVSMFIGNVIAIVKTFDNI
jgi:hypothetical protein